MAKAIPEKTHPAVELKHDSPFISCRYDPSGQFVFAGAQDNKVWRWTVSDQSKVALEGHESWVRGMAFLPSAGQLITGGYDGRLIWWPIEGDKPEAARTIEAHAGWIRAVATSPDGKLVASAGNDLVVRVWDAATGNLVREMPGHESHVYNLAFHPTESGRLVSGDLKAQFIVWNTEDGSRLADFKVEPLYKYDKGFKADIGGPRAVAFSKDGRQFATAGITNVSNAFAGVGNPLVVVTDWQTRKEVIQHASKAKLRGVGWGVAMHPDGFVVGISGGGGGGHLLFWKPDGKEEFHTLKLPNTSRDLDLHPGGIDLAVAHYDSRIRIYRMAEKAKA